MRILVAPVLVGDRLCRIVSPVDSLLEVEEWVGEWWEPSSVTLTTVSQAPAAPMRVLLERGVPPEDHGASPSTSPAVDLQSLLRATEPAPAPSARIEDSGRVQPGGSRRRQYTGSGRFRRPRATPSAPPIDRADLRRGDTRDEWRGPWRRATDVPPNDPTGRGTN
ncbi:MAG: hypothetical protein KA761_01600 [Gemmatimonadaceae bacterium]|nr:hypothetical protein [Gemmatimonadaceae bacterium]